MTVERIFMVVLLWIICFVVLPMQLTTDSNFFQPEGPDAFMRLERVNTLVESGDWYDGHIARAAGPEGADIHWTRPMDLLILGVAAPLVPLMGMKQSIEIAGVALPAIMSITLVFVCVWAVIPLMRPGNLISIVILLAVQPTIQNYFGIGRVDHHMVLAVLMAAVLGCLMRFAPSVDQDRHALVAGMLSGLGIWISLEFLIVYTPIVIGLGVCWLVWGAPWRGINRNFALGAMLLCLIGIVVDVPPDNWLIARYDRISVAQLFLVACPAAFWFAFAGFFDRRGQISTQILGAILFAALCLGLAGFYFPNLFVGPVSEADPRIGPIWYDKVSEMLPLTANWRSLIHYCLLPFVGIIYGGFVLLGKRSNQQKQTWVWLLLVLICTGTLALSHIRAALYLAVVGVIAAGPLMEDLLSAVGTRYSGWKKGATGLLVRTMIILGPFFLALMGSVVANGLKPSEAIAAVDQKPAKCNLPEIASVLSNEDFIQGRGILKFANNLDFGPELIYRTPHHFLAVPYHRNGEAIYDAYALLTATDFTHSRELLLKYGIDYILICPNASDKAYFQESEAADVLYNRLVYGNVPEDLTEIDVPKPWKLFEFKESAK